MFGSVPKVCKLFEFELFLNQDQFTLWNFRNQLHFHKILQSVAQP